MGGYRIILKEQANIMQIARAVAGSCPQVFLSGMEGDVINSKTRGVGV